MTERTATVVSTNGLKHYVSRNECRSNAAFDSDKIQRNRLVCVCMCVHSVCACRGVHVRVSAPARMCGLPHASAISSRECGGV
eukprot:6173391-Pleurochrysis_carterae.AAC.2